MSNERTMLGPVAIFAELKKQRQETIKKEWESLIQFEQAVIIPRILLGKNSAEYRETSISEENKEKLNKLGYRVDPIKGYNGGGYVLSWENPNSTLNKSNMTTTSEESKEEIKSANKTDENFKKINQNTFEVKVPYGISISELEKEISILDYFIKTVFNYGEFSLDKARADLKEEDYNTLRNFLKKKITLGGLTLAQVEEIIKGVK